MGDDVFGSRTPEGRVVGFPVFSVSKHDGDRLALPPKVTAVSTWRRPQARGIERNGAAFSTSGCELKNSSMAPQSVTLGAA